MSCKRDEEELEGVEGERPPIEDNTRKFTPRQIYDRGIYVKRVTAQGKPTPRRYRTAIHGNQMDSTAPTVPAFFEPCHVYLKCCGNSYAHIQGGLTLSSDVDITVGSLVLFRSDIKICNHQISSTDENFGKDKDPIFDRPDGRFDFQINHKDRCLVCVLPSRQEATRLCQALTKQAPRLTYLSGLDPDPRVVKVTTLSRSGKCYIKLSVHVPERCGLLPEELGFNREGTLTPELVPEQAVVANTRIQSTFSQDDPVVSLEIGPFICRAVSMAKLAHALYGMNIFAKKRKHTLDITASQIFGGIGAKSNSNDPLEDQEMMGNPKASPQLLRASFKKLITHEGEGEAIRNLSSMGIFAACLAGAPIARLDLAKQVLDGLHISRLMSPFLSSLGLHDAGLDETKLVACGIPIPTEATQQMGQPTCVI